MSRNPRVYLAALALLFVAGCGATVGDACTTPDDCGGALCVTTRAYTPGGYCTRQCALDDPDSCPQGSLCVEDGAGSDLNACFLSCTQDADCRSGHVCRPLKGSLTRVCAGPDDD